jgi:hypothetical protein
MEWPVVEWRMRTFCLDRRSVPLISSLPLASKVRPNFEVLVTMLAASPKLYVTSIEAFWES